MQKFIFPSLKISPQTTFKRASILVYRSKGNARRAQKKLKQHRDKEIERAREREREKQRVVDVP